MNVSKPEEGAKKKRKKIELPIVTIKTTADYQRMKLERLMANPDKPVNIPERPKDKNLAPPPEFVRNIMGSSAGAGSGEFHVYRHLRRKEYARQKAIQEKAKTEGKLAEFQRKREEAEKLLAQKIEKKRKKRLKKKKLAQKKKKGQQKSQEQSSSESSESSDDDPQNSVHSEPEGSQAGGADQKGDSENIEQRNAGDEAQEKDAQVVATERASNDNDSEVSGANE